MAKIVKQSQRQTLRIEDDDGDDRPRRKRPRRSLREAIVLLVVYVGTSFLAWNLLPQVGIGEDPGRILASVAIGIVLGLVAARLLR